MQSSLSGSSPVYPISTDVVAIGECASAIPYRVHLANQVILNKLYRLTCDAEDDISLLDLHLNGVIPHDYNMKESVEIRATTWLDIVGLCCHVSHVTNWRFDE